MGQAHAAPDVIGVSEAGVNGKRLLDDCRCLVRLIGIQQGFGQIGQCQRIGRRDGLSRFQIGQRAFHVDFPQGRPGEAYSRLIGRETLVARGRYNVEEPVLAWAEQGRTSGLRGSLAGISGGPAFAANGQVIGVTVAESARRGRIYTAAPSSIVRLLRVEQVEAEGAPAPRLTSDNYGQEADDLRRGLAVAQVVCVAPGDRPDS